MKNKIIIFTSICMLMVSTQVNSQVKKIESTTTIKDKKELYELGIKNYEGSEKIGRAHV